MSEKRDFGSLVREKRRAKGLSIEAAAARCGISGRGLSNLERGISEPLLPNLLTIAAALEIDLGELDTLKSMFPQEKPE